MAPTLDNTIGALQVGSLIGVFLFGIVVLQSHLYYERFRDDKWPLKTLVAVLLAAEFANTFLMCTEVYVDTIKKFGHPEELDNFPYIGFALAPGGFATFIAHGFFSYRIWKVLPGPYNYFGGFIFLVALVRFIGALYLTIGGAPLHSITEFQERFTGIVEALFAGNAIVDGLIAVTMLWYLISSRRNAMRRSTRLIDRLITYTIRSGLLTVVVSILNLVTFKVWADTLIWGAIYAFLPKLYSISVVSALNDRAKLRDELTNSTMVENSAWSVGSHRHITPHPHSRGAPLAISVEMKSTREWDPK